MGLTTGAGTVQGERSDTRLVERARSGDREAFGALYDRYGDRIHDFCARFLHDVHEGADATHDAFLLAAERLDQLRDPGAVRPWLYRIARRACLRRIRARDRARPSEVVADVPVDDHGDDGVHRDELRQLVGDAAAGLADRDRQLLDLRLRHELSPGEIAEVMDVTPAHASVMLGRMRERVERSLGALLVARQGSDACAGLRELLVGWDGRFDPRLRKRVARHVDDCGTCRDERSRVMSPANLLSVAPLLVAPVGLREQIVRAAALPAGPPPAAHAVPPPAAAGAGRPDRPSHRRRALVLLGLLLLGGGAAGGTAYLLERRQPPRPLAVVPITDSPTTADPATPTTPPSVTDSPSPAPAPTTSSSSPDPTTRPAATEPSPSPTSSPEPTIAPELSASPTSVTLPPTARVGTFDLAARGGDVPVEVTTSHPWLSATPESVEVPAGEEATVEVSVVRDDLPEGTSTATVTLTPDGLDPLTVPVEVEVQPEPPVISDPSEDVRAVFAEDDNCRTELSATASVADESELDTVDLVTDVDGDRQSTTMALADGSWSASTTVDAGAGTFTWWVEAADVHGATGASEAVEVQGQCPY